MLKYTVSLMLTLALVSGAAAAQDIVITGFPLGTAGSVQDDFFQPYHADLAEVAQALNADPAAVAVITGCADGAEYHLHNDAMNPGLALGRAHTLRNYLVAQFRVNPDQLIVQSNDVKAKGDAFRSVTVHLSIPDTDLATRIAALEDRPPVEKHIIERVQPVPTPAPEVEENLGMQFGVGVATSPYGAIPTASAGVEYKEFIAAEALVGHTFWNNSFHVFDLDLSTKRRLIGGYVIVSPNPRIPVGIVGGWVRVEEISRQYYEYVRLSEGPILGVRVMPFDYLAITGAYNPVNQRQAGVETSDAKNGHFMLSISTQIGFGGGK